MKTCYLTNDFLADEKDSVILPDEFKNLLLNVKADDWDLLMTALADLGGWLVENQIDQIFYKGDISVAGGINQLCRAINVNTYIIAIAPNRTVTVDEDGTEHFEEYAPTVMPIQFFDWK
jgi:hypothetical protein